MISIVLTTYNRKEKLEEAIKSVLNQSFDDFELVVVDDHSTDGTKEMMKGYTKNYERISYIYRDSNFGTDTRPKNEGIEAAKGEYIAFLDDDNIYRPDHLSLLYKAITESKVDLVYGDRMITYEGKPKQIGIFSEFDPYLLLRRNYIDTSDVLVKKDVLIKVGGFDERYQKYVDWNLWVRLAKAGYKFKHVPMIITDYEVSWDSKSGTKMDEKGFSNPAWNPMDTEIEVNSCLHKVKNPKVGIFSITYDRLDLALKSFDTLRSTAGYPFKHYVLDNGSSDRQLVNQLNKDERIHMFHPNTDNLGISIASNLLIESMIDDCDIIVKVDPDAIFLTDGWLKAMVEIWKSNRMMVLSPYIQGLKDNPGGAPRQAYGQIGNEILGLTKHVGGIVCFADKKVYENFRWDEKQPLHGVQDVEFSTYARLNGYQCAYLENFFVSHGLEGTEAMHEQYKDYFERRKFEKTHAYGDKV